MIGSKSSRFAPVASSLIGWPLLHRSKMFSGFRSPWMMPRRPHVTAPATPSSIAAADLGHRYSGILSARVPETASSMLMKWSPLHSPTSYTRSNGASGAVLRPRPRPAPALGRSVSRRARSHSTGVVAPSRSSTFRATSRPVCAALVDHAHPPVSNLPDTSYPSIRGF